MSKKGVPNATLLRLKRTVKIGGNKYIYAQIVQELSGYSEKRSWGTIYG